MILVRDKKNETTLIVVNPNDLLNYDANKKAFLLSAMLSNDLKFSVPTRFVDNTEKTTYKVGYLFQFIKLLIPSATHKDVYDILNTTFQVFLGERQLIRYIRRYETDMKYIN
jgi:hypothetical protein